MSPQPSAISLICHSADFRRKPMTFCGFPSFQFLCSRILYPCYICRDRVRPWKAKEMLFIILWPRQGARLRRLHCTWSYVARSSCGPNKSSPSQGSSSSAPNRLDCCRHSAVHDALGLWKQHIFISEKNKNCRSITLCHIQPWACRGDSESFIP